MEVSMKSNSTSKINVSRKINFEEGEVQPENIKDMEKKWEEYEKMKLSEEAREALKKVQRFDRIIYAKETEKICREVIKKEIQRLERIKNG